MTLLLIIAVSIAVGIAIGALMHSIGNMKMNVLGRVTQVESMYESYEIEKKFEFVMTKIKDIHPLLSKVLGDEYLEKVVEWAVERMQKLIGSTSERIELQEDALKTLNKDIITKTKEFTAKTLSQNIIDREFFGDFTKASNEQVREELNKILESTQIDDMIASNLKKIKTRLLQIRK